MNTLFLQLLASKEARSFAKQIAPKNPDLVILAGGLLCVAYCMYKHEQKNLPR